MPAPRRKRRKPEDHQVMKQVETFLPESAAFMKLLELERQMDYTLRRKRLAIHEALHRPARVRGTLRVYLFNTYANQADQKSADPDAPPSWTLYVSGRLVDGQPTTPAQVAQQALQKQAEATPLPGSTPKTALKFSTFIQSAKIVVLNPKTAAPSESIVWDAQKATEACDAFEVKRLGDADTKVQVQLTLGSSPDRFQLSAALASLLGITIESRMYIIASLWQYIKVNKLQGKSDPTMVECDDKLAALFGEKRLKMSNLAAKLAPHLSAPPPVTLEYTVGVSGHPDVACYDLTVDVPDYSHHNLGKEDRDGMEDEAEAAKSAQHVKTLIARIREHKRRRSFYLGFSHSPVDFVNSLVVSQSRDLQTMAAGDLQDFEYERRSEFYTGEWVDDAVMRYLQTQPKPKKQH